MAQSGRHAGHRRPRRYSPEIELIIRRRRRWAWAAIAALVAIVFCGGFRPSYPWPDNEAHAAFFFLMLALWAAALCCVGVGTLRLRRRDIYTVWFLDAPFRPVQLRARRRNDPVGEWLLRLFPLALAVLAILTLPDQVNAIAYLGDSTPTAIFLPQAHTQHCGKNSCVTYTTGVLEGGGARVTWPGEVSLGEAFPVHAPVWQLTSGTTLMTGNRAVGFTLAGMFLDAAAVAAVIRYAGRLRRWRQGRGLLRWIVSRLGAS